MNIQMSTLLFTYFKTALLAIYISSEYYFCHGQVEYKLILNS